MVCIHICCVRTCSYYTISRCAISHSFQLASLSKLPSFVYWFVLCQLPSDKLIPVHQDWMCNGLFFFAGSRSVATWCCPAGFFGVGYVNRYKCPAVHLDEFAAGSFELVNSNCPTRCIQSIYIFVSTQLTWAGCWFVFLDQFPVSHSRYIS